VKSLRTRLIAGFLLATVLPLGATIWVATTLLERSLEYATTGELDRLSRTLEDTARRLYQRERDALGRDVIDGRSRPTRYPLDASAVWPERVRAFWDSAEPERFQVTGASGDRVELLRREPTGVAVYARDLGDIHLQELSVEFARTREVVSSIEARDLRRGFTLTLLVLAGVVWLASLVPLVLLANRISRPMRQLNAGLTDFAAGDWDRRLDPAGTDEVGRAIDAFNRMAGQLRASRDRLVYLTQVSSWQSMARKTAHELKNALTPIRLTVEEMVARQPASDRAFMERAAQIVIGEIEALERWVRAFSEFASEPPVTPQRLDLNAVVEERIALLRAACPAITFERRLDDNTPMAYAGADLVKSILTNLLQNAAEAAREQGTVLVATRAEPDRVVVEIHDSGPGLSPEAAATLFQPTITFKQHGMGLGLSIARKYALLSGGDVARIPGALGGAGFQVVLPAARA
jgi:nitrogen fixation/metabolism regulation signal transduction histidine kinase